MKLIGIRKVGVLLSLLVTFLLSSCGGGTQVKPFVPSRIIVFGDENSVIDSAGRTYSINGLNATTGALDCTIYPIWVQQIATAYGQVFPQCNPNNVATKNLILAQPGATVTDVKTQIDNFINGGGIFTDGDLVLILAGQNDVFTQYATYPATSAVTLATTLNAQGVLYAQQVNRVGALGAHVVVSKLQDVSLTPYITAETLAHPGEATLRNVVVHNMVLSFTNGFFATLNNDANHIGLFDPDQVLTAWVVNAGNGGLASSTVAACLSTAVLPNCNTNTLVAGASPTTYLWADDRHMTYEGHLQLAALAYARSNGNPF